MSTLTACTHDTPLRLAQFSPGMSESSLRKAAHKAGGTATCSGLADSYRQCEVSLKKIAGTITAVLDADERVVLLRLEADSSDALTHEAILRRAEWGRVAEASRAEPHVELGDTGVTRWVTRRRKWSGEMHYRGVADPDVPSVMIVADESAVLQLMSSSDGAATMLRKMGALPPSAEDVATRQEQQARTRGTAWTGLSAELATLAGLQASFKAQHDRFAASTSELDMMVTAGTRVSILSATPTGWAAEATHPEFPGLSCVVFGGDVSAAPVTRGGVNASDANAPVCDAPSR